MPRWLTVTALACTLPAIACYRGLDGDVAATVADDGSSGATVGTAADESTGGGEPLGCQPSWVGVQRLNVREYGNTLHDLLGVEASLADDLPIDARKGGFDNNASALGMTPELYERYLAVVELAVPQALAATPDRFIACTPAAATFSDPCVEQTVVAFAERAYRRELDDDDRAELAELYQAAAVDAEGFTEAVTLVFEGVLLSPSFLYRNQVAAGDQAEQELDDFALASRLSYFVWSSMPDDELFELARAGGLREPVALRVQVQRMLLDDKAEHFIEHFTRAWLDIGGLGTKVFDPTSFPEVDADLLARMQAESVALVRHVIREELPPSELLTAEYGFIDDVLAAHYGLPPVGSATPIETPLPADERRGIVTHGSVLATAAHPDRTSIPARGMWVMDNLLCLPPPPPPPADVDQGDIDEDPTEPTTQRERFEEHRANPTCAACHATMDELGFGLEHYDAVGRWRELEDGLAIDASGTLPDGRSFDGALELAAAFADDPVFVRCVAQNLLGYGLGRLPTTDDACTLDEIVAIASTEEASLAEVIAELVVSDVFRYEAAEPPEGP
jgi:Protein of unknown function (DUF1592)/Protein of unknown function (DUF1588)/Protein of unknown function (DUF1587)/Protein of unknown function (DUF1595)/Protein of unknown function (DUF1585)